MVEEDELAGAEALGVWLGLALVDAHETLAGPEAGEQFAEEQENQAGVGELDAGLSPGKGEAVDVRAEEIGQQQAADEVAAREDGQGVVGVLHMPEHGEAPEIFGLHGPDPEVHLVEGGHEHEDERQDEQRHRELERDEELL